MVTQGFGVSFEGSIGDLERGGSGKRKAGSLWRQAEGEKIEVLPSCVNVGLI